MPSNGGCFLQARCLLKVWLEGKPHGKQNPLRVRILILAQGMTWVLVQKEAYFDFGFPEGSKGMDGLCFCLNQTYRTQERYLMPFQDAVMTKLQLLGTPKRICRGERARARAFLLFVGVPFE